MHFPIFCELQGKHKYQHFDTVNKYEDKKYTFQIYLSKNVPICHLVLYIHL